MYVLPGYVNINEENKAIVVTSSLSQNAVKLTVPSVQEEFRSIVQNKGCSEISTQLTSLLHEQGFLMTKAEIETKLEQVKKYLDDVLRVTIMPTEGCNFRCRYCYQSHHPASMRRKTLEQIHQYLTTQASKYKRIHIDWFGGEPTLCKDIVIETNSLMQKLQETNHFQFVSSMTTNGYLLDPDTFLQFFHQGVKAYQITLDGKKHDTTRPHVLGQGTLRTILDNLISISKLSKEQYPFRVLLRHNILPNDTDFGWYDDLYELFGTDDRFSVIVRPVGNWGGETVHALELLQGSERIALLKQHIAYLKQIGMRCDNGKNGIFAKMCYASYPHSMIFRSDGKIEKCTVCLNHPKNNYGYVDDEQGVVLNPDINDLWCCSNLKTDCYGCSDLLSCLNMSCKKAYLIDGKDDIRCSQAYTGLY